MKVYNEVTIDRKSFKITTTPGDIDGNTLDTNIVNVTNNKVNRNSIVVTTTNFPLEVVNHSVSNGAFRFQLRSNNADFVSEEININFVVL